MTDYDTWLATNREAERAEVLEEAWFEYCEEEELDPDDQRTRERWLADLEDHQD